MALELDHVLIAVADLSRAAMELEATHGLASVEGGRHPGWGTGNRIVPLGETYLELIGVVDEAEAATNPFGRWVGSAQAAGRGPFGWAVRTSELDDVATRLGLTVTEGTRTTPAGTTLRWRSAGAEAAAACPLLPFFLEWAPDTPLPGRTPLTHPAGDVSLARLELAGDEARLDSWLGDHDLPVEVDDGPPGVRAVVLIGPSAQFAI